ADRPAPHRRPHTVPHRPGRLVLRRPRRAGVRRGPLLDLPAAGRVRQLRRRQQRDRGVGRPRPHPDPGPAPPPLYQGEELCLIRSPTTSIPTIGPTTICRSSSISTSPTRGRGTTTAARLRPPSPNRGT